MGQWLKELVLAEAWGLIPCTLMVAHNCLELQIHSLSSPLMTSIGMRHVCGSQTYMCTNSDTHKGKEI